MFALAGQLVCQVWRKQVDKGRVGAMERVAVTSGIKTRADNV